MRKRPLCFVSIALVLILWMLQISGDGLSSPETVFTKERTYNCIIYGSVFRREIKPENSNQQIIYLKQAVLSVNSQISNTSEKLHNIRVTCSKDTERLCVADWICIEGTLNMVSGATNPGQFDMQSYYDAKKVSYTMWQPEVTLIKRPEVSFHRLLSDIQCRLAGQYDEILPNQYGALLKGITLGDKTGISDEVQQLFQTGGISHILAISGLHLQILGNTLYQFLRRLSLPMSVCAIISGSILIGYGFLTGASVATLRALIMFLIRIGADVTGRTYDAPTGIALSAVVLTAGNPDYLLYSGFWLSFFAVCSFVLFREKRKLGSGILLYFFMAPVMLIYFYELSLYSIFLNLLVVPTISVVLVSGLLGCIGSLVSIWIGKLLVFPAAVLLGIYQMLCRLNEALPFATYVFGKPAWMQVILYYVLVAVTLYLFRKYRLKKRRFFALGIMIFACLILTYRNVPGLEIAMLDVGQGDGMVLQSETGSVYMIDGGSTTEDYVGRYRILPYLKYIGANEIEAVFVTHADADHMNGILELLQMIADKETTIQIETIVLPDWKRMEPFSKLYELAKTCRIPVICMGRGDVMTDGDLSFQCLHPNGEDYRGATNEGSLVLQLKYQSFSMLFTGDLEGETEENITKYMKDVDVLKVAHHGSKNSTSEAFLEAVKPEVCLISCGKENSYGHPHKELLERLYTMDAAVFQTSVQGALILRTDGENIDLKTDNQYNES